MQNNGTSHFLLDIDHDSFEALILTNSIAFYFLNWLGLLILIVLVYRIRHTGDDTYLRKECGYLVGNWVFFSIIQYMFFIYNYIVLCQAESGMITTD